VDFDLANGIKTKRAFITETSTLFFNISLWQEISQISMNSQITKSPLQAAAW
jgi:hypothetical protein